MELLTNIWPFSIGDQVHIFYSMGAVVFGLFLVNIFSAFRQKLPIKRLFMSFFSEVAGGNKLENNIRTVLLFALATVFMVLVLDIGVNGMQLSIQY